MSSHRSRQAALVVALAFVPAGAACGEPTLRGVVAPLERLAGSCWMGTFADGKTRDLVCYEPALAGDFLRSRHRVIGGPAPYSGETMFGPGGGGALEYTYFNTTPGVIRGRATAVEGGLDFSAETVEMHGQPLEIRSVWRWRGADGYSAVTEKKSEGGWREWMRIEFVRVGPLGRWNEAD